MEKTEHHAKLYRLARIKKIILLIPTVLFVILVSTYMIPIIGKNLKDTNEQVFEKKNTIGVIQVNQVIEQPFIEQIIGLVQNAKQDHHIKGFLFVFNSPGGDPSASQNFMIFLEKLQKEYPVYGYVNTMCTSGCYYSVVGIKEININKNAMVGSVGVLMQLTDASGLGEKIGVKDETLTIGKFKKPFSNLNGITLENKAYIMENMLKPVYENFIDDVISHRKIEGNRTTIINKYFEGKVFIGNDKQIQGVLVDNIIDYTTFKEKIMSDFGWKPIDMDFVDIQKRDSFEFLKYMQDKLNIKTNNFKIF